MKATKTTTKETKTVKPVKPAATCGKCKPCTCKQTEKVLVKTVKKPQEIDLRTLKAVAVRLNENGTLTIKYVK